jgi:hypothetical protein
VVFPFDGESGWGGPSGDGLLYATEMACTGMPALAVTGSSDDT